MVKLYKLIILDRDGVINEDSDEYIKSPEEWQPIAGSLQAIAELNRHGHLVAVISNQSGIGRGYFSLSTLQEIHAKMKMALAKFGGHIDVLKYCPHHPNDNCDCRKPKPKMLLEVLHEFNIANSEALIVGDSQCDIDLAKNSGCAMVLVKTGKGIRTINAHPPEFIENTLIFENLAEVVSSLRGVYDEAI